MNEMKVGEKSARLPHHKRYQAAGGIVTQNVVHVTVAVQWSGGEYMRRLERRRCSRVFEYGMLVVANRAGVSLSKHASSCGTCASAQT
jgi:hypothetical protein